MSTFRLVATATVLALLPLAAGADDLPPSRTSALPVPPGQIDRAVESLDGIVAEIQERSGVPGIAVAVVHDGETLYAKGFGLRGEGDAPVTAETVFQIASVSKSIAATVVARQVSEGVVSWDSRMQDLLPWFRLSDPAITARVTVGDLFSHRSGLPDHAGDDLEDLGFGREIILERLAQLPLTPFRTSYAYTNFGLTAAAEGVAQASGMAWSDLVSQSLLEPLGMATASARFDDFMARDNRAVPQALQPSGSFAPLFQRNPDAQSPAGGMSASVEDMAKWMKMVLNEGGDLIDPDALMPALSPQAFSGRPHVADERPGFYGYGFNTGVSSSGRVVLSHSGAFIMGAATAFTLIPSLDLGIITLTNASPVGVPESINAAFADIAQTGAIERDWFSGYNPLFMSFYEPLGHTAGMPFPEAAAPAPAFETLTGSYGNAYFGTVEIRETSGQLTLYAGPEDMAFPLKHWDDSTFVFDIETENAAIASRSVATFTGGDGEAEMLEIELFSVDGVPGQFERM